MQNDNGQVQVQATPTNSKFCKHCGNTIDSECVVCPKCGKQVEQLATAQASTPSIVINNTNTNTNVNTNINAGHKGSPKNKTVALLLCIFLGCLGAHKFYEGKILMGVIYFCTMGIGGIGWIIDIIILLGKPSTYYV